MAVPEPFATTLTITSSILINIASDIVEHHAKDLKGRFAGSLLKWAGLMEPDFDDRLRETLRKALQLFFQTYPQYDLSGIDTLALMQEMGTAKLVQPDEAIQTIQQRFQALPTLFTDGLCKGRILHPAPYEYFVSHGFPTDTLVDWRKTLTETLAQASKTQKTFAPYFPGDTLMGGYRFCGICEKLYATRFSILLLPPSQDRNVYLELGIALGMRSPFLLIQPREAQMPPILEGLSTYVVGGTFRSIRQQLPGQLGKIEEYNFAVVHPAKNLPTAIQKDTYLIAAGNLFDDEDAEGTITDVIKARYPSFEAISLTQVAEIAGTFWMLEQLITTIQNARFAIYRVNEHCSPTTFLALGISIALNRPFLMLKETRSEVPLDLRGIALYQFPHFTTLEKHFVPQHQAFFDKYAQ